jgi:hypothetical protein
VNERDTCKCWSSNKEVRCLRVFDKVLLLELSVNLQRILSTFSIFKWEKHSIYGENPVILEVMETCIPLNNTIKIKAVVSYTLLPLRTELCCQRNTPYQSLFSIGRHILFKENKPE